MMYLGGVRSVWPSIWLASKLALMKRLRRFLQFACACLCFTMLSAHMAVSQTPGSASRVTLRIIVVADASSAQQVLNQLGKGEDFALLAKDKVIVRIAESGCDMGSVSTCYLWLDLS